MNITKIGSPYKCLSANHAPYPANENIKPYHDNGDADVYFNEDEERGYCTWGWFEDNVLNTFFGFVTKKKGQAAKDALTTRINSRGTKYIVKPAADSTEVEQFETIIGNNKCRMSPNLYTKSKLAVNTSLYLKSLILNIFKNFFIR